MKHRGLFFLSALIVFLAAPALSGGAVRMELKNGRSITADDCRQSGNVFVCSKMGGSFEIEKGEVAKIRKVSGEALSEDYLSDPAEPAPAEPEGVKGGPAAETGNTAASPEDRRKEAEKKIDELQQRKLELSKERENLVKERDALREENKKAPDWMPEKKFDELQKRNAEFDAKLKKFNTEVKDIEGKEKKIDEEMAPTPTSGETPAQ